MTNRNFITILSAAGLLTLFTGCSLLESVKKASSNPSPSKDIKTESVLPTDKEQIATEKTAKIYSPEELSKGIVKGDWVIETVNGKQAIGEQQPFIRFVPEQKRIYGNNGCNVINAEYACNPADSTMLFGMMTSTMMACNKTGITDFEINGALDRTRFYTWRLNDSQYELTFYDEKHVPTMTLMHQNFSFLNGTWKVKAIDEEPVSNDAGMYLVFDIDENKLHGNTGCNILNGEIELNMEKANSISFQQIGMTRMACPDTSHETQFVVALERVTYVKPISPDKVLLLNDDGKAVLSLIRATDDIDG